MSVECSLAAPADAEEIARIFHQVSLIHYQNLGSEFKEPLFQNDLAYIQDCLNGKDDVAVIKAVVDSRICGYLILYIHHFPAEFFVDETRGFVGSIGVDTDFRGQGVGREMLAFAENHLRRQSIKVFDIDVYTFNTAAEKLYNSCGFQDIKRYKRKYI